MGLYTQIYLSPSLWPYFLCNLIPVYRLDILDQLISSIPTNNTPFNPFFLLFLKFFSLSLFFVFLLLSLFIFSCLLDTFLLLRAALFKLRKEGNASIRLHRKSNILDIGFFHTIFTVIKFGNLVLHLRDQFLHFILRNNYPETIHIKYVFVPATVCTKLKQRAQFLNKRLFIGVFQKRSSLIVHAYIKYSHVTV